MSRYSEDDETRIRAQTRVRDWTRAGLLDPPQGAQLESELRVDVRRTNVFLRVGLALFTALIVGASVLFVIVGLNLSREIPIAAVTCMSALACIALAEALITRYRFYRFGVEEALAVAAVVLLGVSAAAVTASFHVGRNGDLPAAAGLLIAAAGGFGIYRRYGFVYAAVGAMACAAAIPFLLRLSATTRHVVAAATLASVFLVVRSKRLRYQDEYPGDDYGLLQAAAWAGLYITVNLKLTDKYIEGLFYWCTYVMTWVLPIAGLYLALRGKDRPLIDVSLAMALVTLLTNKQYLGSPQHEWDPILLGLFLMAVAVLLRRWLSQGLHGQRHGYTAARVLKEDGDVATLLSAASLKFQPDVDSPQPDPAKTGFDGGRSGGGGASGSF